MWDESDPSTWRVLGVGWCWLVSVGELVSVGWLVGQLVSVVVGWLVDIGQCWLVLVGDRNEDFYRPGRIYYSKATN